MEDLEGEIHFPTVDRSRGVVTFGSERGALGPAVVGVGTTLDEPALHEAVQIARQGAGGNPEPSSEFAEPQRPLAQRLESGGLGHGHAAACDIGSLCEGKPSHQEAN